MPMPKAKYPVREDAPQMPWEENTPIEESTTVSPGIDVTKKTFVKKKKPKSKYQQIDESDLVVP
jgi:hypothetical protein